MGVGLHTSSLSPAHCRYHLMAGGGAGAGMSSPVVVVVVVVVHLDAVIIV
jgi:hypothetical protein